MSEKLPPTEDVRCGTQAGYVAHHKRGETPCQPCKDVEAQRAKKRYYANREAWISRTLEYGKQHPEQRRKAVAKWRTANYEYDLERTRQYKRDHPEKSREWNNRRRAKRLGNGYEVYTLDQVISEYGVNCHICGKEVDLEAPRKQGSGEGWELGLHLDHLVPISKGGSDTLENVRPAHAFCNLRKRDNLLGDSPPIHP